MVAYFYLSGVVAKEKFKRTAYFEEFGMEEKINFATASDIYLVNVVNELERFSWTLQHDASHGRIPSKGLDDSNKEMIGHRHKAVLELSKRTGIPASDHSRMSDYIKTKLKEQDAMWDKQWAAIYQEGAVFKHLESKGSESVLFETVRAYLPTKGVIGPKEHIFARIRGSYDFVRFDDRDITKLVQVPESEAPSLYSKCAPEIRGLIKADEMPKKREGGRSKDISRWLEFDAWNHTVFHHKGFDEIFEAMEEYNFPNTERRTENELILSRSHSRQIFVEFSVADLGLMQIASVPQKYNTGKIFSIYPHRNAKKRSQHEG